MKANDINITAVSENELEKVTGGNYAFGHGIVYTTNGTRYESGDTPKYSVGQPLKIRCTFQKISYKIPCEVLAVSSEKNCGIFYKEFGYKIRLGEFKYVALEGKILDNVYESCLYTN